MPVTWLNGIICESFTKRNVHRDRKDWLINCILIMKSTISHLWIPTPTLPTSYIHWSCLVWCLRASFKCISLSIFVKKEVKDWLWDLIQYTLPTSCMSCSCLSCDKVWCLRASCKGVSPSLSGMSNLDPALTNNYGNKERQHIKLQYKSSLTLKYLVWYLSYLFFIYSPVTFTIAISYQVGSGMSLYLMETVGKIQL